MRLLPSKKELAARGVRVLRRPGLLAARTAWYFGQCLAVSAAGFVCGLLLWVALYHSLVPRTLYRWPIGFTGYEPVEGGPWAGEIVPLRRCSSGGGGAGGASPVTVQVIQAGEAKLGLHGVQVVGDAHDDDEGGFLFRGAGEPQAAWRPAGVPVGWADLTFGSQEYARARAGVLASAGFSRFDSASAASIYGEDIVLGHKPRDDWSAGDIAGWAAALAAGEGQRDPAPARRAFSLSAALQGAWASLTSGVHPPPAAGSRKASARAWGWLWGAGASRPQHRGAAPVPSFPAGHEYDASLVLAFPQSRANAKVPRVLVQAALEGSAAEPGCSDGVCSGGAAPVLAECSRLVNLERLAAAAAEQESGEDVAYGRDGRRLSRGWQRRHKKGGKGRRGLLRSAWGLVSDATAAVFDVVFYVPRALAHALLPGRPPYRLDGDGDHDDIDDDAPAGSIARVECFNGFVPQVDGSGAPVALKVTLRGPREAVADAAAGSPAAEAQPPRWTYHHPEVLGGYIELRMRLWGLPRVLHDHAWLLGGLFTAFCTAATLLCCAGCVAAVRWRAGWQVKAWVPAPAFLFPAAAAAAASAAATPAAPAFRGDLPPSVLLPEVPDLGPLGDDATFDASPRPSAPSGGSDLGDYTHDIFSDGQAAGTPKANGTGGSTAPDAKLAQQ